MAVAGELTLKLTDEENYAGLKGSVCNFTYEWDWQKKTGLAFLSGVNNTPMNITLHPHGTGPKKWTNFLSDMKPTTFYMNAVPPRIGQFPVIIHRVALSIKMLEDGKIKGAAAIWVGKNGSGYLSTEEFLGLGILPAKQTTDEEKLSLDLPFKPRFRFKGVIPKHDRLHYLPFHKEHDHKIAPINIESASGPVPQYARTVYGVSEKYDPSGNCRGMFMSSKFQANNNCYNYSTNVATNSFAQPGRMTGNMCKEPTGEEVAKGAVSDGLQLIGDVDTNALMKWLKQSTITREKGHLVALLISKPYDQKVTGWPGDYHWVRCDNTWAAVNEGAEMQWSQKDGGDAVTNFDFAGFKITDPRNANWFVKQGPIDKDKPDFVVSYEFYAYMFVPGTREICII